MNGIQDNMKYLLHELTLSPLDSIQSNACEKIPWTKYHLLLAALAFETALEAMMITDRKGTILLVNPAFTKLTGFSREEVVGRTPKILHSGRQDPAFYINMWASIHEKGHWQGEIWNRRKNGDVYLEYLTIHSIKDESGKTILYSAIFTDITERKSYEERIKHQAYHDMLTGLPNRFLFEDHFATQLAQAASCHQTFAVMFIDLDRFKLINDSLGHNVGDLLLKEVANRLKNILRTEDTISRLGGDEFNVLLPKVSNMQEVATVASQIIRSLTEPFTVEGHECFIGASIGISIYPFDGEEVHTLIRNADIAMYRAKELGGSNYQFYTDAMNEMILPRLELENGIRRALARNEFVLYFQPQVDLYTEQLVGVEALIRWNHPDLGLVSPSQFIPIAEEAGMISQIGEWVVREACRQMKVWQGKYSPCIRVAVNISPFHFLQHDFVSTVTQIVKQSGISPEHLELELTENVFMRNIDMAIEKLNQLKEIGFHLSLDDFGTGYSSLNYLRRFPIHTLKIDQSFLRDIATNPADRAIVAAIINMAHTLQLKVVAEGIENAHHLYCLKEINCDVGQGYHFSKPVPSEDFERNGGVRKCSMK